MDYGVLNGLGITLLAAFGLWAFFSGHKIVEKMKGSSERKSQK